MLARPELLADHPDLVTNRRSTVLHIDALTTREMATLLDGLVDGLPPDVRDVLVQRAEGIPTYAVETVRTLIDRDLVVPRGGTYVLADPDGLDLDDIGAPASLQALISARLDRLSAEERLVVDRASVAGGSVEPELLAELCAEVTGLDRVLADLVRAQIFTVDHDRLSSEQGRYQFVQSAVRQVAYGTLSRRERKQAHLRVLAAHTRDGSEELTSVAAQHAVSAMEAAPEDPDVPELAGRAVDLLRRAAVRARSLGAPREAVGHLRRALELSTDELDRLELELDLARACHDTGRYDEAMVHAEAVRTAFATAGDEEREATAAAVQADAMLRGPADYDGAVALLEPYVQELRRTRPRSRVYAVVMGSYQLAMARAGRGDMDLMAEALAIAELVGDRSMVARVLGNMSFLMARAGNPVLVDVFLEKSIEVAREAHDPLTLAVGLTNMSSGIIGTDVPRALGLLDDAVESTRRLGNVEWISLAHANRTLARLLMGRWDEVVAAPAYELVQPDHAAMVVALSAMVLMARGQDPAPVLAAKGANRVQTSDYWQLGEVLALWQERDPSAPQRVREALELAQETFGISDDFHVTYGLALEIAVETDDQALVGRLEQIVDEATTPPRAGLRGHRALLGALDASRHLTSEEPEATQGPDGDDGVADLFLAAISAYEEWGSPVYVARAQAAYGVWLRRRGRHEEAARLLDAARTTYDVLGASAWLSGLDHALARHPV
jgi:tetratricopeptide (TPR) repeat protein